MRVRILTNIRCSNNGYKINNEPHVAVTVWLLINRLE